MLGIAYFAVYLLGGYAMIRDLLPDKRLPVRLWLSAALGILLMMWLPALMAFPYTFSIKAHMLALFPLCALTLGVHFFLRNKTARVRLFSPEDKRLLLTMACVALPLTALGGYLQYTHVLRPADGALNVGQSTYGDLPLHLGIASSLRNAAFPPDYSILPGERLVYPFLMDSFSTSFMLFGMPLRWAIILPGTLMMGLVFAGYMLLADRMAASRRAMVVWATLFVFLNGGLGFLYSIDTLGVSNGSAGLNPLQAGTWLDRLETILQGWYQTPANHADFPYYNLRWSNIIADMLIPQRTFLGGWCVLLPCIYLLYDGFMDREGSAIDLRQAALLGVMAGGLPLLHTHSFLALGLLSAGWLVYDLLRSRGKTLLPWAVYGGLACLLAAPQLFLWTFRHTAGNSGFVRFQFNWVNNSGGNGLRDGYLWFWIKNIGLPVLLLALSLLDKNQKRRMIASGAFVIFLVSEFFLFQPNEYDNNKLFYVWWALCAVLAADYAVTVFDRLAGLRSRYLLACMAAVCCFATGTLSIARECVSDYQMYSSEAVETAAFVEKNTPEHSTFMTWTQHINPVSGLAGRDIVCGPSLWLYWHGYDLSAREGDIRDFYADPANHQDVLTKYNVDYILVGDYERASLQIDEDTLSRLYPLIFESEWGSMRIYQAEAAND